MATEALKSTAISNMDAIPPTKPTTGEGSVGHLRSVDGVVSPTNGDTAGSTYQMVRLPSNAKVKHVLACLDAAVTTFTADIGVYYGTDPTTPSTLRGTAVNSTSGSQLFGTAVALAAIVTPTDFVNESTTNTAAKRQQPLWQACGLTADPMCSFDITLTLTATTSGAPVVALEAQYVE